MENEIIFEEKQYLGFNKHGLMMRLIFAIFCFFAYFYSDEIPELTNIKGLEGANNPEEFLFFMGILILVISFLLLFVLHLHTKVYNGSIVLDGLWTARKVKIDLRAIVSVKKTLYSKYKINRSVYNLHRNGKIRFFTRGTEAIELIDKDGLLYVIGSQQASQLTDILAQQLTVSNKS